MSSPRKYASPYLTGIPGLSVATSKTKKRSKTSLTKVNDSPIDTDTGECRSTNLKTTMDKPNPAPVATKEPTFDPSCGDMEQQVIHDIISETKAIAISSTADEKGDTDAPGTVGKEPVAECASFSCEPTKANQNSDNVSKHLEAEGDQPKLTVTNEVSPILSLKSILKKPSLYRMKPKNKEAANADAAKKQGKSSKGKGAKSTKENSARALSKQKIGTVSSASKGDMWKSQLSAKSPRRRLKTDQSKPEESEEIPLLPKKSVRFSTKVDVHPVPYESRAGTRACDWQRNMLEQRVQTFRQLMKDVGTDELDLFGSGMLFPGYPYHLPSPNFTLRGSRIRNFKL